MRNLYGRLRPGTLRRKVSWLIIIIPKLYLLLLNMKKKMKKYLIKKPSNGPNRPLRPGMPRRRIFSEVYIIMEREAFLRMMN